MEVIETDLEGVLLIKPGVFEDFRGDYVMIYNEKLYDERLYKATGLVTKFVEHDISTSSKGVLRGIHYDPACWKIYECLYGRMYYVIVDCDETVPTFGKWQSFIISDRNRLQIFKPPKYGAGFLALTDCILHYMQSEYYDSARQKTFLWNDERFGIWWPTRKPILSQRDEVGHYV